MPTRRRGKSARLDLLPGDLIHVARRPASEPYIVRQLEDKRFEHGTARFIPDGTLALWIGTEPVDLSVDLEDCDIIMFEGAIWAVLIGELRRPDVRGSENS